MAKWFINQSGQQNGPFESAQLKQFAHEGKIKPNDLVRREDQTSWSKASAVKGLFNSPIMNETAPQTLQSSPQSDSSTLSPSPAETSSLLISEEQISLSKLLLAAIVSSLFITAICSPWFSVDEDGVPTLSFANLTTGLATLIYAVADVVLLFVSWRSLPTSKRPFGAHPAVIAGTTLIPLLSYAAYFLAYGKLGNLWLDENDRVPRLAGRKDLRPLRWIGNLLAGWLVFGWLMSWADATGFDMSWWADSFAEMGGKSKPNDLTQYLSLEAIYTILLSFWYISFYYPQILIWTELHRSDTQLPVMSSYTSADKQGDTQQTATRLSVPVQKVRLFLVSSLIGTLCFAAIYFGFQKLNEWSNDSSDQTVPAPAGDSSTADTTPPSQEPFSLAKGCVDLDLFLEEMERSESFELTTPKGGEPIEGSRYRSLNDLTQEKCRLHIGSTRGSWNEGKLSAFIAFTDTNTVALVIAESVFDTDLPNDRENNLDTFFSFISSMLPEADARSMFGDNTLRLFRGEIVDATHGKVTLSISYDIRAKLARVCVVDNCINSSKNMPEDRKDEGQTSSVLGDQASTSKVQSSRPSPSNDLPKAMLYLPCDSVPANVSFRIKGGSYSAGKVGIGVQYSGNEVSEIDANLPLGNNPRTLALWIKCDKTYIDAGCHVINFGTFETAKSYGILAINEKWRFFDQNGGLATDRSIDTNWHHHAITYDGNKLIYYLDGKKVADTEKKFNTSSSPLRIGGLRNPRDNFVGMLDEIYIFDVALTEPQIQKLFNLLGPINQASNEQGRKTQTAGTQQAGTIDLITRIDPLQHSIRGLWKKSDGVLSVISPNDANEAAGAALRIEYRPTAAYFLTLRAKKNRGGGIIVPFVYQGKQFGAYLSAGWRGSKIPNVTPEPHFDEDFFPTPDWHTVTIEVGPDRIRCVGDSGATLEWKADYASVRGRPFDIPDASSLYLKAWGEFEIDTLTIREER